MGALQKPSSPTRFDILARYDPSRAGREHAVERWKVRPRLPEYESSRSEGCGLTIGETDGGRPACGALAAGGRAGCRRISVIAAEIRTQTAAQVDAAKFVLWVIATAVLTAAAALSSLLASMPR
jgi:hypothetical protein